MSDPDTQTSSLRDRMRSGVLARFSGERGRRVALSAGAGVAQRFVAILGTFLMYPRVLHQVGTDMFGVWGAASSLTMLLFVADFGVGAAIMTLVARSLAEDRPDHSRQYIGSAMLLACFISVFIAATGSTAAIYLAPRASVPAFVIAVVGLAINIPLGIASPAWMALQRGWMVALCDLIQTVSLVLGLFVAIQVSDDVRVYVAAVYASWIVANAANITILFVRHPELKPESLRSSLIQTRVVLGTGFRFFILSLLDGLSYMLDNVFALQLLGFAASARMAVIQRVTVAAIGLLMVISQPLWPAFVEAAARRDKAWIGMALVRGSAFVTFAAVAGSAIIIWLGGPLLKIWLGTDIGIDVRLLWAMAIWIVCVTLARVQTLLLSAVGVVRFQIVLFSVSVFAAVALKIAWAPRYGVAGILMATAVTFPVLILPATIWRVHKWRRAI